MGQRSRYPLSHLSRQRSKERPTKWKRRNRLKRIHQDPRATATSLHKIEVPAITSELAEIQGNKSLPSQSNPITRIPAPPLDHANCAVVVRAMERAVLRKMVRVTERHAASDQEDHGITPSSFLFSFRWCPDRFGCPWTCLPARSCFLIEPHTGPRVLRGTSRLRPHPYPHTLAHLRSSPLHSESSPPPPPPTLQGQCMRRSATQMLPRNRRRLFCGHADRLPRAPISEI